MNLEKVIFAFFIILALSLNFGFYVGDPNDPAQHNSYELLATLVVSLICTVMKFGDRTRFGAIVLASSLVADLHLIAACLVWHFSAGSYGAGIDSQALGSVVSLAAGALIANLVSVILLITETVQTRR